MFPLGTRTKREVIESARQMEWLDVTEKKESQDFVDGGNHNPLFGSCSAKPGPILDTKGQMLGTHPGIIHYTIGQRKGLRLGGSPKPLYVVRIDESENAVIVGPREDLFRKHLLITDVNWIAVASPPSAPMRVKTRIRQQHQEAPATILPPAPDAAGTVELIFDQPQLAITPGQMAVFYDTDMVVGGGTIVKTMI